MSQGILDPQAVCQVAVVVHDIEAAAHAWATVLGVEAPGWIQTDEWEETHAQYRGRPSRARCKLAFIRLAGLQLELIEPDDEPSTWRDYLDAHGQSIHHIAFNVPDMPAAVAALGEAGAPLVQQGDFAGGAYAYCDGTASLGAILELLTSR